MPRPPPGYLNFLSHEVFAFSSLFELNFFHQQQEEAPFISHPRQPSPEEPSGWFFYKPHSLATNR